MSDDNQLSLSEQSRVLRENLAQTFGGLRTDELMRGLRVLVRLFDSSTESGHALKVVFESIFQPLVDRAASAAPRIEAAVIKLEMRALKALLRVKKGG